MRVMEQSTQQSCDGPCCRQELAAAVAAEGLRPILAPDTPPQLAALLEAAWQLDPAARPTSAQIEGQLRRILKLMEAAPKPAVSMQAAENGAAGVARAAQNGAQNGAAHAPDSGAAPGVELDGSLGEWGTAAWEQGPASSSFQPKASSLPYLISIETVSLTSWHL
jgi:hypothetical protein